MTCDESLRVQAWFDGEVDALDARDIERHVAGCAECARLQRDLAALRRSIRQAWPLAEAAPDVHARVRRALEEAAGKESPRAGPPPVPADRPLWRLPAFWAGALGGIGATALAGVLAFLLLGSPASQRSLPDELVADHVRSLLPSHLIDVASSDQHTVKPWFAGHADVSPVVADFAAQGFRLVGGRADYLSHQRAAVVVYQHGPHLIDVFSWAGTRAALPGDTMRSGYRLVFWADGDLEYCAVSDTGREELRALVRLLEDTARAERSP